MSQVELSYQLDMEDESFWITATPSPSIRSKLPYVQEIGDFITHEKYYTRREGLASYLIKYTISGEGILEYGGEKYTISPGQFFWIDCNQAQNYYTSPRTKEWRIIWIHFYGATCEAFYNLFVSQNSGSNVLTLAPSTRIPDDMRELAALYASGENSVSEDIRASGLISKVMSECCYAAAVGDVDLEIPDCVRAARLYLLNNYREKITLDHLAKRYSMNKYYFQKLFKRYTGFTPNEFLILSRLNKAKEYLRTTGMPIAELAEKVGIDNTSHFINLFKKHEGTTPNVYRRNWYR